MDIVKPKRGRPFGAKSRATLDYLQRYELWSRKLGCLVELQFRIAHNALPGVDVPVDTRLRAAMACTGLRYPRQISVKAVTPQQDLVFTWINNESDANNAALLPAPAPSQGSRIN